MSRLLDVLLSTEPVQRVRLAQAGLAMLLLGTGVLGMGYFVWAGTARAADVAWWAGLNVAGMALFFGLIRPRLCIG